MTDATRALLAELIEAAEAQLAAARTLDAAGLDAATERRHASMVAINAGPRPDPEELRPYYDSLVQVDKRLTRILNAGDRTFRRVLIKDQQTYNKFGRMSGGRL
jgi:hypothetical protein